MYTNKLYMVNNIECIIIFVYNNQVVSDGHLSALQTIFHNLWINKYLKSCFP